MNKKCTLIACKIFEHELTSILPRDADLSIIWIDAALHANADMMQEALTAAIKEASEAAMDDIHFLFGNGCHPDICNIAGSCGSKLPPEKNCIQAILGPEKTKALEAHRTMVITPGWITAWSGIMTGLGWDTVDVRINMGRYDRIVLLDTGVVPIDDEAVLMFYDLVQVPVEIETVDLTYFKRFMGRMLPDTIWDK